MSFSELKTELIIGELLKMKKATIGTAESCTGGKIAYRITSVAGSSNYFKGAVVAYSEGLKILSWEFSQQQFLVITL